MEIYTREQWSRDRTFKAEPGQEITAEIYEEMYNCLPPKALPTETARKYKLPIHAGFLMGEPHSSDREGLLYLAFGMSSFSNSKHYYYLGLSHAQRVLHGSYYLFDCLDGILGDGLKPVREFAGDQAAIRTAADCEATLIRYTYDHGREISSKVLYEPKFF